MTKTAIALVAALILVNCGGNNSQVSAPVQPAQATQLRPVDKTQTQASSYQTSVQELYVAYFGRPADPGGLANFEAALSTAGAPTTLQGLVTAYSTNPAVQSLVNAFGTSKESQTLYGSGTTTQFVQAVFQNVIGRQPLAAGLDFWVTAISSGSLSQGDAALAIMAGALTNTSSQGVLDAQLVNNRLAAASYFTSQVTSSNAVSAYAGASAAASARAMLGAVTATTTASAYDASAATTIAGLLSAGGGQGGTYSYQLLTPQATVTDFLTQANAQGANGYLFRGDFCIDATCTNQYAIYVKNNSSTSTYQYEASTPQSSSGNFVTYANGQGQFGYLYLGDFSFSLVSSSIYYKDTSAQNNYTYLALSPPTSSANFLTQANAQGASGYWVMSEYCFSQTCGDEAMVYVKNQASSSTYTYVTQPASSTSADLLTQANAQGANGYGLISESFLFCPANVICSDDSAIYRKNSASTGTFSYSLQTPPTSLASFTSTVATESSSGFLFNGEYTFCNATFTVCSGSQVLFENGPNLLTAGWMFL